MNKVITLVLCNRPRYTRLVLEALRRCAGIADYSLLVRVEPVNDEVISLARAIDFADANVTVNPRRLGISRNTYHAWEDGFDRADFIVHLEDDTVPAPDCLRYMEHCRARYRSDHGIFSVASFHRYPCEPEHYFSLATRSRYTCWLVGLWKDRWHWAKKSWSTDPSRYAGRLTELVRDHGLREVYPLLSRSQNIGARGGMHPKTVRWHRIHQHTKSWAGNLKLKPKRYLEVRNPMVTAAMITEALPEQTAAIESAIASFKRQSYVHKELLIVNHGWQSLGLSADARIREITVLPGTRPDALRNTAFECADGDLVVWWEENSRHHSDRIAVQVAAQRNDVAVLLQRRIVTSSSARPMALSVDAGFPETILFPRRPGLCYPDAADAARRFANAFKKTIVIDNDPRLYRAEPPAEVRKKRPAVATSACKPLVTAVMVTGMNEARYALARVAIECFRAQTYPHRELLVINDGPLSLDSGEPWLRELRVRKTAHATVGHLRNLGLENARGDFVITWDDDDWHAPGRLEAQLAAEVRGAAVVLRNQIRYNLLNDCGFYKRVAAGIPGTMLHPRDVRFRYPTLVPCEDTHFLGNFERVIAVENDPSLYIRFYHGLNLCDAKHIMGHFADCRQRHETDISRNHLRLLRRLLRKYAAYRQFQPGAARSRPRPTKYA